MNRRQFTEYISLLCGISMLPKGIPEYSKSVSKCSPYSSSSSPSSCARSYYCYSSCSSSSSVPLDSEHYGKYGQKT